MRMAKHIFIKRTIKILRNRDFLLMTALLLGLFAGGGARFTERAILPVLAVGMTLALFGDVTAVPSTVSTIFMLVYLIWLNFKHTRYQEMEA